MLTRTISANLFVYPDFTQQLVAGRLPPDVLVETEQVRRVVRPLERAQPFVLRVPIGGPHAGAIWFALHRLRVSDSGKASVERIATDDIAVLYVFDVPPGWAFSGELQDVPGVRPSRQRGAFVPISWGYRRNRAARYLVGAVYFPGSFAPE